MTSNVTRRRETSRQGSEYEKGKGKLKITFDMKRLYTDEAHEEMMILSVGPESSAALIWQFGSYECRVFLCVLLSCLNKRNTILKKKKKNDTKQQPRAAMITVHI